MSRIVVIAIVCLSMTVQIWGQQKGLPGSEVEVVKDFEARLADSRKLRIPVEFPSKDTLMKRPEVSRTTAYPVEINYNTPILRPLAFQTEESPQAKNAFLKFGYGWPNMPYGEAGYHFDNGENLYLSAYGKHHSARDSEREWKRFADTDIGLGAGYLLENGMLASVELNYLLQDRYLFGFDESLDTVLTDADVKRRFKRFETSAGISNYLPTAAGIDYRAGIEYKRVSEDFGSNEDNTLIYVGGTKWIADRHQFALDVGLDLTKLRDTLVRKLNNVYIRPNFTWHENQFSIKAGLNLQTHDDEFFFFPEFEAKVRILRDKLIAFAGIGGELRKNNFYTLSEINPFITEQLDTLSNAHALKFTLGARGRIDVFTYEVGIRYEQIQTAALFVNQPNDSLQFGIRTDDLNLLGIGANIEWTQIDKLILGLSFEKRFYSLDREAEPWYLPTFEATFLGRYRMLRDRLEIGANLFVEDGVFYESESGSDDKLNTLFDLSFNGVYQLTENFSVFAEVNNVFNNKRERWRNYDTFGFNVLAGLRAVF